jgi:hypothetical protein
MTNAEINRLIAEKVMGWAVVFAPDELPPGPFYLVDGSGFDFEEGPAHPVPGFATSLDACAIAEAEIERRGMDIKYYEALWAETRSKFGTASELHWADVWAAVYALMQSTPLQRCLAMLRACGVDAL